MSVSTPSRMEQVKALFERYGRLAVVLHFSIWFVSIALLSTLTHFGLTTRFGGLDAAVVPGAAWLEARLGTVGLALAGGYAANQLLKVPRIALTLALTPMIARRLGVPPAAGRAG